MSEDSTSGLGFGFGLTAIVTILVAFLEVWANKDLWLLLPFVILILVQWLFVFLMIIPIANLAGIVIIPLWVMPYWQESFMISGSAGAIITLIWLIGYILTLIIYYIILIAAVIGLSDDSSW